MPSRREFLKTLMAAAASAIALNAIPAPRAAAAEAEAPELPWPYTKLDPAESLKRGHLGYYMFECAGGAFWAIVSQLAEKIGHPWTLLPVHDLETVRNAVLQKKHLLGLFQYGYGGVVGWATICGAPNASVAVMQMIMGLHGVWTFAGRLLLRWYEIMRFPSELANQYAVTGKMYVPKEKMKSSKWLPQSVSYSTLCHVSVGRWCMASGYASGSKERSERCGRLTGDTAAATTVILNAFYDVMSEMGLLENGRVNMEKAEAVEEKIIDSLKGKIEEYSRTGDEVTRFYAGWLVKAFKLSATTAACRVCHYKGKDYEMGQFTRGFLQCESCHKDMTPHAHYMFQMPQEMPTHKAEAEEMASVSPALTGLMGALAGVAAGIGLSRKLSGESGEEEK